uniref:Protein kinase domain-containing protein n=1 Tax=Setaria italica TaxID=4555 RepID=K3ZIH5_SETIT
MALCGMVANITQLLGVDLFGLISMIEKAAQTVSQNEEACRRITDRASMIKNRLEQLQQVSRSFEHLEMWKPMKGLKSTLRRAYRLIIGYQHSSYMYKFCCGSDLAKEFEGKLVGDLGQFQLLADPSGTSVLDLTKFGFSQLAHATNYFSLENKIGFGGSSYVYKGQLKMGLEVAVKRASYEGKIPFKHFQNEIELIPKLQHANIVKLQGYCIRKGERILVFEYMPNGSLDSFIYEGKARESLEWPKRRQIIEGIAQGAKYLHQLCEPHIIHGDLKPGNILLDSDFIPKICDFGISKALKPGADEDCTGIVTGSRGFIAPEYIRQGCLSKKSDVYSFGVTLLQIISRKRLPPPPLELSAESRHYGPLNKWAWDLCAAGELLEFIDPSLHDKRQNAEIMRWVKIALLCVQEDPEKRPSMSDVLEMLGSEDDIQIQPSRPAYY